MKLNSNQELWNLFINKIQNEWAEKYVDFGSLNNINGRRKFCIALAKDIEVILKLKNGKNTEILTWNTLNNYLKQDGFGKEPKKKTIEIFEKYLEEEIKRFNELGEVKNTDVKKSEEATLDMVDEESKNTQNLFSVFKTRDVFLVSGVLFLFVLMYGIFIGFPEKEKTPKSTSLRIDKEFIIGTIERANELEFSLYSSLPVLNDTVNLKEFYSLGSDNRKTIIRILKKNKQIGKILDIEKSTRLLNKEAIVFDTINSKKAVVRTIEFWQLQWIDAKTQERYAEYKVVNEQRYLLFKENNKWLIKENQYAGKAKWF